MTPPRAGTLFVDHGDVLALLPMSECIDAMTDALRTLSLGGPAQSDRRVVTRTSALLSAITMRVVLPSSSSSSA